MLRRNSPQGFSLRPGCRQKAACSAHCAARSSQPAEIAVRAANRLHLVSLSADYRKAANNDGFAVRLKTEIAAAVGSVRQAGVKAKFAVFGRANPLGHFHNLMLA
jgi:hypothetical protein